ncbi:MAG: F0F1 ATP synthase subunit alpha, partial [Planctomycetota bacterium]
MSRIQADEIRSVIKQEIAEYQPEIEVTEVGKVLEVGDGIARIYGLKDAMALELLRFKDKDRGPAGQVFNLETNSIGAVILGDYLDIKEGDDVFRTGLLLSVPVGEALIGR